MVEVVVVVVAVFFGFFCCCFFEREGEKRANRYYFAKKCRIDVLLFNQEFESRWMSVELYI